ncbi:MAG TPA: transposase [Caulobacteraceae bacterium]|nr:transposase [Caulobacteraceae bacterium]
MAKERRQFSREFKLMALGRLETAGNVLALAEELGVRRELLYKWHAKYASGGEAALRGTGRPRPSAEAPELMPAQKRIAELERKIGEQAVALDFFRGALRRIEASRGPKDGPGVTASSRRSKR